MAQGRLHCCLKTIGVLLSVGLGAAAWADSDTLQFSEGSVIIPMNANFQDACGTVSAYGLVWRLLQANQPGHYFAQRNHIVTVYVAMNAEKTSPNRCVPSNLSVAPAPSTDPAWNDGCDLAIEIRNPAANQQPVVPVDYTIAFPVAGFYPNNRIPMMDTTGLTVTLSGSGGPARSFPYATPEYPAIQLDNTVTPRFTRIQYGGAPFIIDAPDVSIVMDFLASGDSFVPAAALSPFTTGPFGQCATLPRQDKHYVQMHQATIAFTAPIGRRLNAVPPKIAVLDTGAGVKWESLVYGTEHVLELYLKFANLFYDDTSGNHLSSAGCPLDSLANCRRNGSSPDAGTMYPGQIYDEFNSYHDLISRAAPYDHGLLNAVEDGGQARYRVLWTPHWEVNRYSEWVSGGWGDAGTPPNYPEYVANGDGAGTDQILNSLNNVGYFISQRNHGLMAECISIGVLEGGINTGNPIRSSATESMFTNRTDDNEAHGGSNLYDGKNCTDPDYSSGECMLYRNAPNPFSQIGDFHFVSTYGSIYSMGRQPPTSDYRDGVARLAVTWNNAVTDPPPSDLGSYVATSGNNNGWDIINFAFKDNNERKGAIIYVGGHEYVQTVAGVRIVLGILMHLGWEPIGAERALTAPIGFKDLNFSTPATQNIVLSATYTAVSGLPPAAATFNPAQGAMWRFPASRGHLRAHQVLGAGGLAAGENALDFAALWDAENRMPLPGQRNLFTYFGGSVKSSSGAPHHVIQDGWIPSPVAGTAIPSGCVDVMGLGRTPDNTFGMIPQSGGDGICDLQEALQYTRANPGTDYGVAERPAYVSALAADLPATQQMLQIARGYCFARNGDGGTPILNPTDAQCLDLVMQDNRAHVGGFAHASGAISPPSPNIPDTGSSDAGTASRPTVAFIGGLDGQLHAFYVSGGAGYQGPQAAVAYRSTNVNASTVFVTDWAAQFRAGTPPAAGTELWSFVPASQLPQLRSNNARVDSSSVVSDVFEDFNGSGLRGWHTVLVTSIGGQNREIFALDVTNPLKPQLLWDLVGSLMLSSPGYPYYSPTVLAKGPDPSGTIGNSTKWSQPTALFQLPPASDPGRLNSGFYDYSDLGGSIGVSIGQLRVGTQPTYGIFAASNVSGAGGVSKGLEAFAINASTGQKIWQLEQPYQTTPATWADNAVPPPVSLMPAAEGLTRAYVGDQEGRVWELDPNTGVNVNVLAGTADCPAASPCKFPILTTQSSWTRRQPIATTLALAKLPTGAADVSGSLSAYRGATLLITGTGGADWVPFSYPGELHAVLLDDKWRVPVTTGGTDLYGTALTTTDAVNLALAKGLCQEPRPFPLSFTGKHLFGSLTVSGQMVFFGASSVQFPADMFAMNRLQGLIGGATYAVDLGLVTTSTTGDTLSPFGGYNLANFGGGVAVFNAGPQDNYVIGLEISKITSTHLTADDHATRKPNLGYTSLGNVIYRLKSWMLRFLNL